MQNELVENVANAIADVWDCPEEDDDRLRVYATAAIRVVLEEAAKITAMTPAHMIGSPEPYPKGYKDACDHAAAAIRSMMPEASNDRDALEGK